ncbi:MAG: GNAT family N-acetyltransferase [Bifidobacteriaceae bacterium]|nr:GNAT family N-acetyltransferase [Bifidobacteriaceae bacterium]
MSNESQAVDDVVNAPDKELPTSIHIPMIKGEMLQLRPARLEDLDILDQIDAFYDASTITGRAGEAERSVVTSWVRDSVAWSLGDVDVEATLYAHGHTRTISWTMLKKVAGSTSPDDLSPIGMIFLTRVDAWSRSARIQVVLGRDFRGRGYSRDAMPRVMTYGFAAAPVGLNLHRVWVTVPEKNTRAISVYQSLGFTLEGTLRHALWDEENSKYQDQVIMGTLADEYDPVRALDTFGMRMNPDNPGVKEALSAHEHSIEIVRDHHDGTMEVRPKRATKDSGKAALAGADGSAEAVDAAATAGSDAAENAKAARHRHRTQAEDDVNEQWPYPERDGDAATSSTSKRAWWRRLGHGRDRDRSQAADAES